MPRRGRKDGPIEGESPNAENEKGWHCVRGTWKGESRKDEKRRRNGENREKERHGEWKWEKISKMTKVAKRRSRGESTPFQALLRNPSFSFTNGGDLARMAPHSWNQLVRMWAAAQACPGEAVGSPSLRFGKVWLKPARIISFLGAAMESKNLAYLSLQQN